MTKALLVVIFAILFIVVTLPKSEAKVEAKKADPPVYCAKLKTAEERILCRLNFYSEMLVKLGPPYVWGGFWGILGGDCSGQIYWICRRAGLPVTRTTSLKMWLNKGAWPGERILAKAGAHEKAQFANLGFIDYSKDRPRGHVVFIVLNAEDKNGKRIILFREASSSKKIFKETIMRKGDYRWVRLYGIISLDLTPGF